MADRNPMQAEAASDRALGYLRVVLVLMVIAHHVATAYSGLLPGPVSGFPLAAQGQAWGAFPIVSSEHSPVFAIFLALNDTFFMSLLFLLSGVFVTRSIGRRGALGFAGARIFRIGVPFLIGAVFLGPLAYFPAFVQITGSWDVMDFANRWLTTPNLSPGPVWFLWLLLAFDLAAALLFLIWKGWAGWLGRLLPDGARRPARFFLVLMLLSAAAYIPMAAAFGSSKWTLGLFNVQIARVLHYALYFTVGVALGACDLERSLLSTVGGIARGWWVWLLTALLAPVIGGAVVVGAMAAKGLDAPIREIIGGVGFVYLCAAFCFVFLALFLRFVRKPNPVMDSLQAHSFGIYLVHYVFVNWLNYALLGSELSVWAQFGIAFVGASALSWGTAVLARRVLGGGRKARQLRLAHA